MEEKNKDKEEKEGKEIKKQKETGVQNIKLQMALKEKVEADGKRLPRQLCILEPSKYIDNIYLHLPHICRLPQLTQIRLFQ